MRWLILVAVLLGLSAGALAQQNAQITLLTPPRIEDDRIDLGVRIEGLDARRLAALTEANFSVSEPFVDLAITQDARLPLSLGVLVNLSANSELALIQRTLHAYFDHHYRTGDTVTFSLLTIPQPYTVTVRNRAEINVLIDGLQLSRVYYSVGDALPELAALLTEMRAEKPESVVMGLLVTSFINSSDQMSAVDDFVAAGIPLHIVQAHTFRTEFGETLRQMALRTGGIFVNNQTGALIPQGATAAVGALKVLYDAMDASRIVFDVSYRSTSLDLKREPEVTLSVQLTADDRLTLPFTYARQFAAPEVTFANPSISATRRPSRIDGGGTAFDVASHDVAIYVRFPDAVPRRIESIELQVADLLESTVSQSVVLTAPEVGPDGAYHIAWALDDYSTPGRNTPVVINVTVTDELGLTASVQQEAGVTVAALPPLPTSTPTPTPTATMTPTPTATFTSVPPTETPTPQAAVGGLNERFFEGATGESNSAVVVLGIIALLALGFAGVLLMRLGRLRSEMTEQAASGFYGGSHMDMPTPPPDAGVVEDTPALGRLIVKRGLPSQEIPINAQTFTIGRKAAEDVQFAIDAPFISPRHCMLTYRNNRFLIRDLGSKNGTFVNGERIMPERDTIVPNGSEVEITRQIVFELWDPDTVVRVEYQMDDAHTERLNSRISTTAMTDSVAFPSALGIRAAAEDDDAEIGDDYSPV